MRVISKLATFGKTDLPMPLPTPATNAAPVAAATNAAPAEAVNQTLPPPNPVNPVNPVKTPEPASTNHEPRNAPLRQGSGGQANHEYRLWHDHKGGVIKAKWIDTAKDGKSITLETEKGRRIRAVLHKFSDADQDYIKSRLK